MKEPISWSTAERVAERVARSETFATSYLRPAFEVDVHRLTVEAEELVRRETALLSPGAARVRVVERSEWAQANVGLFRQLLRPLTEKLAASSQSMFSGVSRTATGVQLGVVLGWMSSRVLGQYDMPGDANSSGEHDIVYYVAPNVLSLEKRFGFPPEEFRLWIAIHECTHRAQFTGVQWLPAHFRSLVEVLLADVEPDTQRLKNALDQVVSEIKERRRGGDPDDNGGSSSAATGMMALMSSPEQKASLNKLLGLMALLEGHAEVVMSRAGAERIPSAERFHRVIAERRNRANGVAKLLQRLLGLDAKMKQYAEGAAFVREVESAGGAELLAQLWRSSEDLPVYDEIRKPSLWIERHGVASHI